MGSHEDSTQAARSETPFEGRKSRPGSTPLSLAEFRGDCMDSWLISLRLPGWLRAALVKSKRCECGEPAVALGMWGVARANSVNAMWLCAYHVSEVDAGVTVHMIPGANVDPDALLFALVRSELKRLSNHGGPPDMRRWDRDRDRRLPEAAEIVSRLGYSWQDMVELVTFVR